MIDTYKKCNFLKVASVFVGMQPRKSDGSGGNPVFVDQEQCQLRPTLFRNAGVTSTGYMACDGDGCIFVDAEEKGGYV